MAFFGALVMGVLAGAAIIIVLISPDRDRERRHEQGGRGRPREQGGRGGDRERQHEQGGRGRSRERQTGNEEIRAQQVGRGGDRERQHEQGRSGGGRSQEQWTGNEEIRAQQSGSGGVASMASGGGNTIIVKDSASLYVCIGATMQVSNDSNDDENISPPCDRAASGPSDIQEKDKDLSELEKLKDVKDSYVLMGLIHDLDLDKYSDAAIAECFSNIPVIVVHYKLEDKDIQALAIVLKKCKELAELEFRDCGLTPQMLGELRSQADCMILKLCVCATKEIGDLMDEIFQLVKKGSVEDLNLKDNELSTAHLESIKEKIQNTDVIDLDISYNKTIAPDGFSIVGEIVKLSKVKKLRAVDCDLSDKHLKKFKTSVENWKIEELDFSFNTKVTVDGYKTLAKIVSACKVDRISLHGCELTAKKVKAFLKPKLFFGKKPKVYLTLLDVSHNDSLGAKGIKAVMAAKNKIPDLEVKK